MIPRRVRFSSPLVQKRFSLGLIILAGLVASTGGLIRAMESPGSSAHSAGYLFDAVAWLVALGAALSEAKSSDLYFQIAERQARRRALILTLVGSPVVVAGCVLASAVLNGDSPALTQAAANGLITGGASAALAGLFSLGWFYGGGYAARRVEKLADEEW